MIRGSQTKRRPEANAFTLIEIMIVIAIISLLAAIAVPNFMRARKRSQATTVLEDLRVIDAALSQYAAETNKMAGATAVFANLEAYIKTASPLYLSNGSDRFGNAYGTYTVDSPPTVSSSTYGLLSDVAPDPFWSPFH